MTKYWALAGMLSAGLIFAAFPPQLEAAIPTPNRVSGRTLASRHFNPQANALFAEIRTEGAKAMNQTDEMRGLERSLELDWQYDAGQWVQLRAEIDHMGQQLTSLEEMRSSVTPWQRRTIDRIDAALVLSADNANDAINFMNANHNTLWKADYQQYLANLYADTSSLSRSAGNAVEYSTTLKRARVLRHDLSVHAS